MRGYDRRELEAGAFYQANCSSLPWLESHPAARFPRSIATPAAFGWASPRCAPFFFDDNGSVNRHDTAFPGDSCAGSSPAWMFGHYRRIAARFTIR